MKKINIFLLVLVMVFSVSMVSLVEAKQNVVSWTAYDLGSTGFTVSSAIADALIKKDIKMRVVPAGDDISRLIPVRTGDVDFAAVGFGASFVEQGLFAFADIAWGPQPVRMIIQIPPTNSAPCGIMTRGDSGLKVPADLKGKKVAWVSGAPAINIVTEAVLAFGGLKLEDVEIVEFPSYSTAARAVIDGSVDVAQVSNTAPISYEAEASVHGVGWIATDPEDKEGWTRLNKVMPALFPIKATTGGGISEEKPVWNQCQMYPVVITWASQDEETVYMMTKAIQENYDLFKDAHPSMPNWKAEIGLASRPGNPYHPGAIKYYKEAGLWNDQNEKWQKEKLEEQEKLKLAWENAIKEADEKTISAKDFSGFWMEKRKEALN